MKKGLLYFLAFLSAFLLFQIEFIIGKIFLPNFGGSFTVWGACVVFFQATLLLGYFFAHIVLKFLSIRKYRIIHVGVMLLPLFFFPGKSLSLHLNVSSLPMVVEIFRQLALTIGMAFFVLSTMSIILQVWLSQSDLQEKDNPYILFGVSNLGSFTALFTYPFYFELFLTLSQQLTIWRIGYGLLVAGQVLALKFIPLSEVAVKQKKRLHKKPSRKQVITWLLYGSSGVVCFLSITNFITNEIAPIPLLWMIPLAIYLLTFVLVFKKRSWAPKWITQFMHVWVGVGSIFYFVMIMEVVPIGLELGAVFLINFIFCLYAQYRLHVLRPSSELLPSYYVYISLGGFLGGVVTSWVIPLITVSFLEYLLAFCVLGLAMHIESKDKQNNLVAAVGIIGLMMIINVFPLIYINSHLGAILFLVILTALIFLGYKKSKLGIVLSLLFLIFIADYVEAYWKRIKYNVRLRNYYGTLKVHDYQGLRTFSHGSTIHGTQLLDESKRHIPLSYYGLNSPISGVLKSDQFDFKNIGVIGLGAGVLTTFLDASQRMDYYEIDPDVVKIAKAEFTYLEDTAAEVSIIVGDARKTMEAKPANSYDLIVADAFSGDAVPLHLVTKEAIQEYKRLLRENGVLVFHVSNRYIDIGYALMSTVVSLEADAYFQFGTPLNNYTNASTWIAVSWNADAGEKLVKHLKWHQIDPQRIREYRIWTDEYSTILPYIKYDEF